MNLINPVLIVVDLQVGFLNEHSATVVEPIRTLTKEIRLRNLPIAFTRFRNLVDSPFERLMGWTKVRDSPETELYGAIASREDHVIEKPFYTAFTDEFSALVARHDWRTLILCGVSTESCVLKTAVDAFERDVTPIVIDDACASDLGQDMHFAGLEIIKVLIGKDQVMNTEKVLNRL